MKHLPFLVSSIFGRNDSVALSLLVMVCAAENANQSQGPKSTAIPSSITSHFDSHFSSDLRKFSECNFYGFC